MRCGVFAPGEIVWSAVYQTSRRHELVDYQAERAGFIDVIIGKMVVMLRHLYRKTYETIREVGQLETGAALLTFAYDLGSSPTSKNTESIYHVSKNISTSLLYQL